MEESNSLRKFTEEEVGLLTLNEASLLMRIMDAPARTLVVDTKSLGSVASKLKMKGMIRPLGRVGTKIRWQFFDNRFTAETRKLVQEIVSSNLPLPI